MLTVKVDTSKVRRMLTELQQKQIPFATMTALNSVAFAVQKVERAAFATIFKSPRPFTQKSVLVTKATKKTLTATVFVRPEAAAYLLPYEVGGVHEIPGKLLLDPIALKLDSYGQLTRTQVANLNAAANNPTSGIFLGTVHGIYGYWQRVGSGTITKRGNLRQLGLRLLAKLEAPSAVNEHLGFVDRGTKLASDEMGNAFAWALTKALASARP